MSRVLPRILLLLALTALLAGLARFALLRFQSGDQFPAYSTLRADPVGTKALYESLRRLEGERVVRNLEPFNLLKHGPGKTILFLGVDSFTSTPDEDEALRDMARDGGRVIVALDARQSRGTSGPGKFMPTAPPKKGPAATNVVMKTRASVDLLGLDVMRLDTNVDTNRLEAVRVNDIEERLPETMPWFGRFCLIASTNEWETIYSVKDKPVVVAQKVGLGTIIVMADSFPFSNEALHVGRATDFLLWALGTGTVTFDETHLGLKRGSGVAVLMREFRLQGLAAACLLLAGLWIWRNSAPLVPAPEAPVAAAESVEGKTAREAIVYLLRRNLNDVELLKSGVAEWAKANPAISYWQTVRLKEAQEAVKRYADLPKPRDLAAAQRQIAEILYPKKT